MNRNRSIALKSLHFWLFLSLLSLGLQAQEGDKKFQRVRLGLTVSPDINWTRTTGQDMKNYKTPIGFNYGFIMDLHFSRNYALGTGLLMEHQAFGLNFFPDSSLSGVPANLIQRHSIQSLQLPICLKLQTNEIGYLTYWGELGVLPAVRLAGRSNLHTNFAGDSVDRYNAIPYTRLFNFSLQAAAGIEYNVAEKTSLLFGIEYRNGFANQFRVPKAEGTATPPGNVFTDNSATLNQIVLRLGVLF